jgi:hypothetical protein
MKVSFLENGPEPGLLSGGRSYSQGAGVVLKGQDLLSGLVLIYKVIIYGV